MNKAIAILCLMHSITGFAHAQSAQAGGVLGAKFWYSTRLSDTKVATWKNNLGHISVIPSISFSGLSGDVNFHPATRFQSGQGMSILLDTTDLSQLTIFTVYQPDDAYWEKIIWHFMAEDRVALIQTTHRTADLETSKYFNPLVQKINLPRISTFTQYKKNTSGQPHYQSLHFGELSQEQSLPITHFKGLMPEVLIFDRVLTSNERIRVESYLALKYGITLFHNGTSQYLNSFGEVIWDGQKNEPAFFNIAGIGRDDVSGLYQKQSSSSYAPGLVTIGANRIANSNQQNNTLIPDQHFLIWGDDAAPLVFVNNQSEQNATLGRRWTMDGFGAYTSSLKTSVSFDLAQAKIPFEPGQKYWLIIDRSGSGKFPKDALEFVPAYSTTGEGNLLFQGVFWDIDQSGKDVFTFGKGPSPNPENWAFETKQNTGVDGLDSFSIEQALLYPNPVSKNQFFNLELGFEHTQSLRLSIHDAQGKLLQHRDLQGSSYYFYTGQLNVPGAYSISLESQGRRKNFQLIVE